MSRRVEECPTCHQVGELVWVHSHLQCPACKTVVVPCCNGETADGDCGPPGEAETLPGDPPAQPGRRRFRDCLASSPEAIGGPAPTA